MRLVISTRPSPRVEVNSPGVPSLHGLTGQPVVGDGSCHVCLTGHAVEGLCSFLDADGVVQLVQTDRVGPGGHQVLLVLASVEVTVGLGERHAEFGLRRVVEFVLGTSLES